MAPTLLPGDVLLVAIHRPPVAGDIVIVAHRHSTHGAWVKRLERILPDGTLFVVGDNPAESTDSRTHGPVTCNTLRGVVTSKLG